jgi:two-component system CheB/CheR fusion protein
MSRLLNALLDISKLESGAVKPDLTDFDIAPLFDELRRDFTNLAANKGLRLSIDAPRAYVHSDSALVSQVLRNLLSNAIKYTEIGSVELRCERRGRNLRIEVRDTGIGIAAEQLRLIFEEFYQVGISPHSSRDGYGLGLSIVQRIARLLNINVDVSSQPGQGSVFAIELPSAAVRRSGPRGPVEPRVAPMSRATSCWSRTSQACATPCVPCSGRRYRVTTRWRRRSSDSCASSLSTCWSPTITWRAGAPARRSSPRHASNTVRGSRPSW